MTRNSIKQYLLTSTTNLAKILETVDFSNINPIQIEAQCTHMLQDNGIDMENFKVIVYTDGFGSLEFDIEERRV